MLQISTRLASFPSQAPGISCPSGLLLAARTTRAHAQADPVASRRLAHSSEGRDIAIAAIARTNAILTGSDRGLRLVPSGGPR